MTARLAPHADVASRTSDVLARLVASGVDVELDAHVPSGGATSIDPMADESVAAASPIGMMGGQRAISAITKLLVSASNSVGADVASFHATST